MPSLLMDDDEAPLGATDLVGNAFKIPPLDPNQPDLGQGYADLYRTVTDYAERQRRDVGHAGLVQGQSQQ